MRALFVLVPWNLGPLLPLPPPPFEAPAPSLPPLPPSTQGFLPLLAWFISVSACNGAVSVSGLAAGPCVIWRTVWHRCPPFWIPRPVICTGMLGVVTGPLLGAAGCTFIILILTKAVITTSTDINTLLYTCIVRGGAARRGTPMAHPFDLPQGVFIIWLLFRVLISSVMTTAIGSCVGDLELESMW